MCVCNLIVRDCYKTRNLAIELKARSRYQFEFIQLSMCEKCLGEQCDKHQHELRERTRHDEDSGVSVESVRSERLRA